MPRSNTLFGIFTNDTQCQKPIGCERNRKNPIMIMIIIMRIILILIMIMSSSPLRLFYHRT